MLKGLWAALQGLLLAMGWIKQRQDQAIGAELQRGKDSQDELVRVTKAVNAGNDPTLVDDSLLATDKNNRANKRKGGAKTSSV